MKHYKNNDRLNETDIFDEDDINFAEYKISDIRTD